MRIPEHATPEFFVGRREELSHGLEHLRADRRALVIVGPSGIGKTAFAATLASRAVEAGLFSGVEWICHPVSSDDLRSRLGLAAAQHQLVVLDGVDSWPTELMCDAFLARPPALITSRYVAGLEKQLNQSASSFVLLSLDPLTIDESTRLIKSRIDKINQGTKQLAEAARLVVNLLKEAAESGHPATILTVAQGGSAKSITVEKLMQQEVPKLTPAQRAVLHALSRFQTAVSLADIAPLLGGVDKAAADEAWSALAKTSLVVANKDKLIIAHKVIQEYFRREIAEPADTPGTLYITLDPAVIPKEDVVELLDTLNRIYHSLGGSELVIRDDGTARFLSSAEVLV